jgi:multidrug efflux pump subunit AcrA (membrane-fusion protein)
LVFVIFADPNSKNPKIPKISGMRKNFYLPLAIVLLCSIMVVALFYIKIPYYIKSNGIVQPLNEWRLEKTPDGKIINSTKNHLTNSISTFSATEFLRGDLVGFSILEQNNMNKRINEGDTIGYMSSYEEELKLLQIKRELEEQKRLRDIYITGEKPEIVEVAYQGMVQAEEQFETQKKITERLKALHIDKIIADQEYELALNEYNTKKQQVAITKANYESLLTGAKKEELAMVDATINNLAEQIQQITKRIQAFTIVSPISGTLIANKREIILIEQELETMARVISLDSMILIMPVELGMLGYFEKGSPITFSSPMGAETITANVYQIEREIRDINQRQMVFVTSIINQSSNYLLPNLKVDAQIDGGEITLAQYIVRLSKTVVSN